MGGTTAKLVDAPTFDGRGIAATLPRSEVEQAIAGKGDVSLKLEVKARPEGAADFEGHILEIGWDRADLERMLEQDSGDQVTLTFDARELAGMIEPDVEGQALRERVAILTVAVAAATAGTASYVATTTAHHDSSTPSYAYVHSTAPIEQVSDAATGGYGAADTGDVVSRAAANLETSQGDVVSRQLGNQPAAEQVSDAASGGGYAQETVQGAEQYAGYQHSMAPAPDLVSDAASGGGYAQDTPEVVSDAATGGYTQDTGDVVSRQLGNQPAAEQVSDAASGGGYAQETVQGAEQYAGYVHPTAASELTSDAASGGGYAQETVQGAEQYAGYQHSAAPSVATGAEMTDVHNRMTDAAAGGAAGTELRSDAATGGYTAPATPTAGDSGTSFDTPGAPGMIAGGIALLITGAALVTGKARLGKDPKPA